MNPKLVARIKAPDTAGKSSIGTGYPISHEWVLTAAHVVAFDDRGTAPVMVEWLSHEPVEVMEVKPLNNDIALLRCVVPVEVGKIPFLLASKLPAERVGWKSAGYPDVNGCELFDATGAFGADLAMAVISLTLDDTCRQDKWGGMSGAPVFSGDKFCAVITTHDQRMERRLNAVSIPWLLINEPEFRKAVGLDEAATVCQKFIAKQKRQIKDQLVEMEHSKLFLELVSRLGLLPNSATPVSVGEKLLVAFDQDCLALFDTLLQASDDALKQDASDNALANTRTLFCLFASLMVPTSLAARQAFIRLSVYTKMATELHLAPLYDTNPDFTVDDEGELKGKYAVDASVFTRETGWLSKDFQEEAFNIMFTAVNKGSAKKVPKVLNAFEYKKFNTLLKQRQNRSRNQLHRFELNCGDENVANNPLYNPDYCQALNAPDCLPDLPVVHYGEMEAGMEAELSAKMDELFEILRQYGQAL